MSNANRIPNRRANLEDKRTERDKGLLDALWDEIRQTLKDRKGRRERGTRAQGKRRR